MMMKSLAPAVATAMLSLLAVPASADVLYDNFGPNDTYNVEHGWTISYGGPAAGDEWEQAVAFTVTGGDYYFDAADVAIFHWWGPDIVHFALHADDNGTPGAILDTASASGTVPAPTQSAPMTAHFGGDVILEDGQTYWLSARSEATDAWLSWANNIVGDYGLRAYRLNGSPWQPVYGEPGTDSERGVFRIHGTLVPAPGMLALLGVAGAAGRPSRRRHCG